MPFYRTWTNDELFWERHYLRIVQDVLELLEVEDPQTDKDLARHLQEIEARKQEGRWTEPEWGSCKPRTQLEASFLVGSDRMKCDPREMLKTVMNDRFKHKAGYIPNKVDEENLRTDPKLVYILYYNTPNATREDIAKLRILRTYTTSQLRSMMINKTLDRIQREGQQYVTINGKKLRLLPTYITEE